MSAKRSAKGRFISKRSKSAPREDAPTPKRRKRRRNPEGGAPAGLLAPVANPPDMSELAEFILPGFAGYGATKMLSRIVYTQLSKRYPNAGKHLAAGSTVLAFLGSWFLLHRIKKLAPYQMPATVGAGIAALQTIVSSYLPRYGWMVSDVDAVTPKRNGSILTSSSNVETLFPGGPEIVDDGEDDDNTASADLEGMDLGSLGGGSLGGDDDLLSGMN